MTEPASVSDADRSVRFDKEVNRASIPDFNILVMKQAVPSIRSLDWIGSVGAREFGISSGGVKKRSRYFSRQFLARPAISNSIP